MCSSEPFAVPGLEASVALHLPPESLSITPQQVNRYAGGNRYRPDETRRRLARETLATAGQLITPALVYAVHMVARQSPDGTLELHNGRLVKLSGALPGFRARCLATLVCTLGSGLEKAGRELHGQGKVLEALFLDAAGTALLEALAEQAYNLLGAWGRNHGLFTGCRLAPGYETMPLAEQAILFRMVDTSAIGVQLNRHLVMTPNKSLSFFVTLTDEKSSSETKYKCRSCSIKNCRYRLTSRKPTPGRRLQSD